MSRHVLELDAEGDWTPPRTAQWTQHDAPLARTGC